MILLLSIIFFITLIGFNYILFQDNKNINSLLNEKKNLLQTISTKKETQAKILYLQNKYSALTEFMKDDAKFSPYYNLLTSALNTGTQSANLKSFQIDKDRAVDFKVTFTNNRELLDFFKFVETPAFLANFLKLSLNNFVALSQEKNVSESYELSFTGIFKQINDN